MIQLKSILKRETKLKLSVEDRIFYSVVNGILVFCLLIVAVPLLNVISSSLSSAEAVVGGRVFLWPVDFTLDAYKAVIHEKDVMTGYANTIVYTVVGTVWNIFMTLIAAYPLSRDDLPGKKYIMYFFTFTMLFNGGLVPTYLLYKNLGLVDNRLVMIIPGALSVYNMSVVISFFKTSLPHELLEAAEIDGCSDIKFFAGFAVPLAKPVIAVIALYYGVSHWNAYFQPMIYLQDQAKYPLSLVLKEILAANMFSQEVMSVEEMQAAGQASEEVLKYALIILSSLPIWCIYPVVQKFFVKGVMVGSLKG